MHEYFPPATPDCPTFDGDSEWTPVFDGAAYFAVLDESLDGVGAGDEVLVAGLELDPGLALSGQGCDGLGDRLLAAGVAGVDVRVLLAGKVTASFVPFPGLASFRANAAFVRWLNETRPDGWPVDQPPPLDGHALVDYSGPLLGSNHQKTVVITKGDEVTAFVGGIDLVASRKDVPTHDRLALHGHRWGWHDMMVRLRGPAAAHAHDVFLQRWAEAATLPPRPYLQPRRILPRINRPAAPTPPAAAEQKPRAADGTSVRVLRSLSGRKLGSVMPWRRADWDAVAPGGVQEIFETLSTAIAAARRYVYIEDQYLAEYTAGQQARYELYPYLRDAAARGVKVILLGSGIRDPDDPGFNPRPINRRVNHDLKSKIIDKLDPDRRDNVAVFRLEHATVHAKLTLVDDAFAHIGSANLFSRSMAGVDSEIGAAVTATTSLVRDVRVQVWGEHLRAPLTPALREALADLDVALGIWDQAWLPAHCPSTTWREPEQPPGFRPAERVLARVGTRGFAAQSP